MLWYKGWLETRFRLLFAFVFTGFFLALFYVVAPKTPPSGIKPVAGVVLFATSFVAMVSSILAGAGINTQAAVQATKGLHGSTLFTLSLPVSRFRLLAVRASLGWLELAGAIGVLCWAMWEVFPILRATTTGAEMLEYAGVLLACASSLHVTAVLLSTFLDDLGRMFGSMIAFAALWWLSERTPLPASVNLFRAMGEGSPLIAHTVPWAAMACSVLLAAILFLAALKIVERREY